MPNVHPDLDESRLILHSPYRRHKTVHRKESHAQRSPASKPPLPPLRLNRI